MVWSTVNFFYTGKSHNSTLQILMMLCGWFSKLLLYHLLCYGACGFRTGLSYFILFLFLYVICYDNNEKKILVSF